MRIVYLHGFASGPSSSKAQFFRRRFEEHGVPVEIPQLDESNFQALTITGQLAVIDRAVAGRPSVLMGSSLGGYLAALYASTSGIGSIERLVLLAPAFHFPSRWRERYAGDLERWKNQGSLPFFHYASKAEQFLGYQFVKDAARYPDEPEFRQPALILHGTRDPVVPVEISRAYGERHPNVQLRLLDSAHELTDVLDPMWEEVAGFLEIDPVPKPVAG